MDQILPRDLLERAPLPELTTVNGVVMSVVFVTAQPTFTGVIGGYTTLTDNDASSTPSSAIRNTASAARQTSSARSSSLLDANTASPTQATAQTSTASADQSSSTNAFTFGSDNTNTSSSSSSSSSNSPSLGAKIGVAIGIICGLGAVAALTLLFLARKRRQMKQHADIDDEKKPAKGQGVAGNDGGRPNAPRLSLRPVSRLVPEFMGGGQQRNRTSQGNMLTAINETGTNRSRNVSPAHELTETKRKSVDRPRTGDNPFNDPENPFADPEKGLRTQQVAPSAPIGHMTSPATSTPLAPAAVFAAIPPMGAPEQRARERVHDSTADTFPGPQIEAQSQITVPASVQAPAPASGLLSEPALLPAPATAQASKPVQMPSPIIVPAVTTHYELPGAPSPVVASGPGPESPQGNVYRILMDFRPTMDDELELRGGQLVRMLHEYDDGWALCIRLDRSQQGVVPRTCLAAKPSKPRPGPPHTSPGSRPMTPQGRPRGPPGPSGPARGASPARAQSPATQPTMMSGNPGAFNQTPRPLSPGPRPQPQSQKRSESPGPYGANGSPPMAAVEQRRRSNSASAASVRSKQSSPPGPSKLGPGAVAARSDSPGLAM